MNKRSHFSLIVIFFGLIIFLIFFASLYYLTSIKLSDHQKKLTETTPSKNLNLTATDKVYKNSQFGFSLTLPSDWGYQEQMTTKNATDDLTIDSVSIGEISVNGPSGPTKPYLFHPYTFQIFKSPNLSHTNLIDFSQTTSYGKNVTSQKQSWKEVNYGGLKGIQAEYGCMADCTVTLLRKNPNTIFLIYGENKFLPETDSFLKKLVIN